MSNKIKSLDLPRIWAAPDNNRLISKQISIRLPIHVAAKIYALEGTYPNKTRTQIINDLLASALEDIGDSIPSAKGNFIREMPIGEDDKLMKTYRDAGLRGQYYNLFNKNYYDLEKEVGNDGEIVQYHPFVDEDGGIGIEYGSKK